MPENPIDPTLKPAAEPCALIKRLHTEISLLQELHVLSQTEYLVLERGKNADLQKVLSRKEALTGELCGHAAFLTEVFERTEVRSKFSHEERQTWNTFKEESLRLLDQIGTVERKNKILLEGLKSQAIQSLHRLQQELKLQKAYHYPKNIPGQLPKLVG